MDQIKSISAKFKYIFLAAFLLVPLLNFAVWLFYEALPNEVTITLLPHILNLNHININPTTKLLACLVCMLEVSVIWFALYQLIKLFGNYEKGQVFSLANVNHYKKLGYAALPGLSLIKQ